MRKFIVAGIVAGLMTTGGIALASGPGPNGNNTFGLCTAYSSGSQQGQTQKQAHGAAFIALEATATAWDAQEDQQNPETDPTEPQETTQQKVAEYCAANGQHP